MAVDEDAKICVGELARVLRMQPAQAHDWMEDVGVRMLDGRGGAPTTTVKEVVRVLLDGLAKEQGRKLKNTKDLKLNDMTARAVIYLATTMQEMEPADWIKDSMLETGFSHDAVRKAKTLLGVESDRVNGLGSLWEWIRPAMTPSMVRLDALGDWAFHRGMFFFD